MMEQFNLTKGQIAWRRVKMSEFPNEAMFRQEYPLTPEEAFISSGNPVFNVDALLWYKTRKEMVMPPAFIGNLVGVRPPFFEENQNGYLSIWKKPDPKGQYVIGADPANGVKDGDYSCAQVLDRRSLEQVAVWHGRCDQDIFGQELNRLGYYYNTALIAPERNAGGIAVLLVLRELFYPNLYIREKMGNVEDKLMPELGWSTDMKTKPIIISDAQQAIRDKQIMLHDEQTIQELFSYAYDDAGHANATIGSHDDRVMALMIAIEMYKREPLVVPSVNDLTHPYVTQGNDYAGGNNDFYTDEPSPI